MRWIEDPPSPRAVLLLGARRVGKTTLLRQAIERLVEQAVPASSILYATLDHPVLKLSGVERVIRVWRDHHPAVGAREFVFLDEVQSEPDWQVWTKHQVDFSPQRRIVLTGSCMPISGTPQESGVGRWHAIRVPTMSFVEYLQIRGDDLPTMTPVGSLAEIDEWSDAERARVVGRARELVPHFHEYLIRGGFPETARMQSVTEAQKLLREDVIDKALKRDMTAMFGVRRVLELEKTFLYLCMHDGGILNLASVSSELGLNKQTVGGFIELLESANLIYRLRPYGYGKEILRSGYKVYLADPAISGSVLLRGRGLIQNDTLLGHAVETAFVKHILTHFYRVLIGFWYWQSPRSREVDVVAEFQNTLVPFEVKYASGTPSPSELKGLAEFCDRRSPPRAYVITRDLGAFGTLGSVGSNGTKLIAIPAPLACYWLSRIELDTN